MTQDEKRAFIFDWADRAFDGKNGILWMLSYHPVLEAVPIDMMQDMVALEVLKRYVEDLISRGT